MYCIYLRSECHIDCIFPDVPDEDPVLRTDMQKVSPGAIIKANCTTPSSYPQMNVTWFINGAEVGTAYNRRFYAVIRLSTNETED